MTVSTPDIETTLDHIMQPARLPRATYRVQFNQQFTFQDALELVDYLYALGISDLYASPVFKPRSGSTHGYDIIDHNQFNPALGTEDDFNALATALAEKDMGILLDIVPNHMGVSTENVWWMDVLKHGPSSVYASYFDIDWRPHNRALDDRVLLPILGDHYGRVLEAGEMKLVYWHGDFYLHYYEQQFPIAPETYGGVLQLALEKLLTLPYEEWAELELESVIRALHYMPPYNTGIPQEIEARRHEQIIVRWRLLGLFDKSEAFRIALQRAVELFNGVPGNSASFDNLDDLLARQPYRLSYWRVASDEINYRRFFDINDLAAIRVDDPRVFSDTHRLALRLLAEGKASGLRIDHPDGLWNPPAYFMQLQEEYVAARLELASGIPLDNRVLVSERLAAVQKHDYQPEWPLYVVVEKILSETEPLPYTWAVYGTTGYDFLNVVNNLFVDAANEAAFDALYADFVGQTATFSGLIDYTKKLIMAESLTSEIDACSALLARIIEGSRRYRGFTQNSLSFGLSEIIAALPIYRTYITGPGDVSDRDRHYIEQAAQTAKRRNPLTPGSIFDFLRDTLLMENLHDFTESQRAGLRNFVMKFQQITGPVMAKSVEDTAFYVYNRLVSLNEVGSHPEQFGLPLARFHQHNADKAFPYTMLTSSTHDTKRGEDVRARINVLSEMPAAWAEAIARWSVVNAPARTVLDDAPAPSPNDEYLLYQTLIGIYPDQAPTADDLENVRVRATTYMYKAINEAKTHSNWVNPNDAYARAIGDFIAHILENNDFRQSFDPFQQRVAFFGRVNALSQALLKLTSPGVPDIYQGCELWNYSLVDPDNRRPVDFAVRHKLLADLIGRASKDRLELARDLVKEAHTGVIKLYLTWSVLAFGRDRSGIFRDGTYTALEAAGEKADHACAFIRQANGITALVVAPRLVVGLTNGEERLPLGETTWGNTWLRLPTGLKASRLESVLTGETITLSEDGGQKLIRMADMFSALPVGLFEVLP